MVREYLEVTTNLNHDNYFNVVVICTLQDMGIYTRVTSQSSHRLTESAFSVLVNNLTRLSLTRLWDDRYSCDGYIL